jgi:hypothetical protein
MSLDYKFQPLEGSFPRDLTPYYLREDSRFGKTWTEVQVILERELRMLNFRSGSVVLKTAHSPFDVRKDGKLRSDVRKPEHPGVVLSFEVWNPKAKRYEQMSFNCDKFTEWKANVRAIADGLESLRKIDRYGVFGGTNQSAHYEGYKALPSSDSEFECSWDVVDAVSFLVTHSEYTTTDICRGNFKNEYFEKAYRSACRKLHPDSGGSHEEFVKLQKYYEILKTERDK